jgi:hypothetical protein
MSDQSSSIVPDIATGTQRDPDGNFIPSVQGHANIHTGYSRTDLPQQYSWMTTQPSELIRIFDSRIQVVHWQRQDNPVINIYLQQVLASNLFRSGFRTVTRVGERLDPNLLPDFAGRKEMVEDIFLISDIYSELLGCNEVALRLEVLGGAMCPRFHVDRTGIRLVCAYRGRGTEWIDDRWVDRSKLGIGSIGLPDNASGLFDSRTPVEVAAPFDVMLFKGLLWQGNSGRGAIHRSPAVVPESGPRILLVMDAIWN